MLTLRLSASEATTIMVALRELQDRMDRLPAELRQLAEGELLDEIGIDDLCHRMRDELAREARAA
jgi:two-component sensor histidine kinase